MSSFCWENKIQEDKTGPNESIIKYVLRLKETSKHYEFFEKKMGRNDMTTEDEFIFLRLIEGIAVTQNIWKVTDK